MDEHLHDIDKFFYDNIEGHSEYPPKKVWDKIEAGLDRNTAVRYRKKYETVKRVALVLLILFLGVLLYEVISRHPGKTEVTGNGKKNPQQENSITQPGDKVSTRKGVETIDHNSRENNSGTKIQQDHSNLVIKENAGSRNDKASVSLTITNKIADIRQGPVNSKRKLKNPLAVTTKDHQVPGLKTSNKPDQNNNVSYKRAKYKMLEAGKLNVDVNSPETSSGTENEKTPPEKQLRTPTFIGSIALTIQKKDNIPGLSQVVKVPGNNPVQEQGQSAVVSSVPEKTVRLKLPKHALSLSIYFSPAAAWNTLQNDQPHHAGGGGGRVEDHNEIKKSENNRIAYSGGVKFGYGLNKKLTIQAGLNYTRSSTTIHPKLIFADRDNNGNVRYRLDCSSGYTFLLPPNISNPNAGDSLVVNDSRNFLSYIGIPVSVEYKFLDGKFSLSASAGGQVNVLLKGKTSAVFGKGTMSQASASSNTQGLRSSYISALAGITGELQLSKKISLTIAAAAQLGLSPINSGASVKTRSNYLGGAAGLKLRL
jgi:hypothetical protein